MAVDKDALHNVISSIGVAPDGSFAFGVGRPLDQESVRRFQKGIERKMVKTAPRAPKDSFAEWEKEWLNS